MDVSSEYIKMCEKAEEIQGIEAGRGSWYAFGKERNIYVHDNGHLAWHDKLNPAVWLPRQDQLQEMHKWYPNVFGVVLAFSDYIKATQSDIAQTLLKTGCLPSMEQLWLAFVMKEKYNKVWNGEAWN